MGEMEKTSPIWKKTGEGGGRGRFGLSSQFPKEHENYQKRGGFTWVIFF